MLPAGCGAKWRIVLGVGLRLFIPVALFCLFLPSEGCPGMAGAWRNQAEASGLGAAAVTLKPSLNDPTRFLQRTNLAGRGM